MSNQNVRPITPRDAVIIVNALDAWSKASPATSRQARREAFHRIARDLDVTHCDDCGLAMHVDEAHEIGSGEDGITLCANCLAGLRRLQ